ncbi:MAG: 16S rRNA (cytidine(1402)-2'-O)-methyltransferase [Oscillospiraceae bacterium]|nr:16S rRNA (cytidine(1402)-2'-O)-methyltransferase [Oscillospiraceae bacterium]
MSSTLYVVGTPIGNLSDMSPRAIETLNAVDLIAAEDTRVTAKLLARFNIKKPMISYHEHNEAETARKLAERMLNEGVDVALVSDAGMPVLSDPGATFVALAREASVNVVCVPGPSAAITALALSGWDEQSFTFAGFLARDEKTLAKQLSDLGKHSPIVILYESPHRVQTLLKVVAENPNARRVLICNDLTKLHEWVFEGNPDEAAQAFYDKPKREKGEYCVAVRFHKDEPAELAAAKVSAEALILERMLNGEDLQDASAHIISDGMARNEVYRARLRVKQFIDGLTSE